MTSNQQNYLNPHYLYCTIHIAIFHREMNPFENGVFGPFFMLSISLLWGVKFVSFVDVLQDVTGAFWYFIRWKIGTCLYERRLSSKAVLSTLYELLVVSTYASNTSVVVVVGRELTINAFPHG